MKKISRVTALGVATTALLVGGAGYVISGRGEATAQPALACDTASTPFCSSRIPLPTGWQGNVFKLAQDYPATAPTDAQPWLAFDPTTQPMEYITAILQYFYDGNIRDDVETSFDPALNTVRQWYNAPWQDYGLNGREPIHGLTRERVNQPFELAPTQTQKWNNYAVGFYNAPGAVTIGKMWANHGQPDLTQAQMPEGTVAAKLLFTTATVDQVPYLAGSPTWNAYVFANPNNPFPTPSSSRAVLQVRLLQIDVAAKDSRAPTGWVFGTFVYGGGPGGPAGAGWTNVAPVGLMWGNDPGYSGTGPLTQTWLNPAVKMPHVGFQGRLNGPVDNPASSCLSCHATAENPMGQMIPPSGTNPTRWFQNIPSGTPFDPGRPSFDYSLQIAVGVSNFQDANKLAKAGPAAKLMMMRARAVEPKVPPRDGGPSH